MTKQFIKLLHNELKKRVNASIFINKSAINNAITVSITKDSRTFMIYVEDIQTKILKGLTVHSLATDICEKYKYHLLSLYFYRWQNSTVIHIFIHRMWITFFDNFQQLFVDKL